MNSRPEPRLLLSIDYEPWFALFGRFNALIDDTSRQELDADFSRQALKPILEMLGQAKISFYLVGEIAQWYPEVPETIVRAGHELGLHCHRHRPLFDPSELRQDLAATAPWRATYQVEGYRAPQIKITEECYPELEQAGIRYSSSVYGPTGSIVRKGKVIEVPVSTRTVFGPSSRDLRAPRYFTLKLLRGGELPFGSSFTMGLIGERLLPIIESELKRGYSPVIFLHPVELYQSAPWSSAVLRNMVREPIIAPVARKKSALLHKLIANFPVSTMKAFLDDYAHVQEVIRD